MRESAPIEHHVAEFLDRRGSRVHLVCERRVDRAGKVAREPGPQLAYLRETEWRKFFRIAPGQHVVQGRAERVDVAARVDIALVLLGWREAERADHGALARRFEQPRDAEINEHY